MTKNLWTLDENSLQWIPVKKRPNWAVFTLGIVILTFILFINLGGSANPTDRFIEVSKTDTVWTSLNDFDEEALIDCINRSNIRWPWIALAQAKLESGNFKSGLFKSNLNLFGMRFPRRRATTAISENLGYAKYSTWQSSVWDYAMYQQVVAKNIETESEYLNWLGSQYAESSEYVSHLTMLIDREKLKSVFN